MHRQIEKLKSKMFSFNNQKKKEIKVLTQDHGKYNFEYPLVCPSQRSTSSSLLILLMIKLTFLGLPWISVREVVLNVVLGRVI